MTKREVVKAALDGRRPPYVPWECGFTTGPRAVLRDYFGTEDIDAAIDNHFVELGHAIGYVEPVGNGRFRDSFGVIWDRTVEQDIGMVEGTVLARPTLRGYRFPDPLEAPHFRQIPAKLAAKGDGFRVFSIGFSLFERAWTLRGMENLLADFHLNPSFVDDLLDAIAEHNIAQARKALEYDIDAIYYGDDWGQQRGLIMGPKLWRRFLAPRLERMFEVTKLAGRYQLIHSCGDIRSLVDDLIGMGVDCINPFQPEAMNVREMLETYRGRVAFHGGLSTQRTLPYGSPQDVRRDTAGLLELGREGSYIFAPSHDVKEDTPLENILAFLDVLRSQEGYRAQRGTA